MLLYLMVISIQKCICIFDIDEVGIIIWYNMFFQMVGNFSFGDYFKCGVIELVWVLLINSFVVGGYGLDLERIWMIVYFDDDEVVWLWQEVVGLLVE